MECKHARLAIQTALDAGRTAHPPQALREHLHTCAACRHTWDEYQAIELGLREDAEVMGDEFPAGLHQKIMATLATEPTTARRNRFRLHSRSMRFAVAVTASLLLIVTVSLKLRTPPPPPPSGAPFPQASTLSIPTISFDINALAGDLLAAPKQDLRELTGSILSMADGLLVLDETTPAPSPTPAS